MSANKQKQLDSETDLLNAGLTQRVSTTSQFNEYVYMHVLFSVWGEV